MSMGEEKARIMQAADIVEEAAGMVRAAGDRAQQAASIMRDVTDGSTRQDLIEATGLIAMFQVAADDAAIQGAAAANGLRDTTLLM